MQSRKGYWIVLIASAGILLFPIWWVQFLPLSDYPHALARAYVSAHYRYVDSFQRLFLPAPRLVPNIGFEGIAAIIGPALDTMQLGKIVFSIVILLFIYGCHRLGVVFHGRPVWNTVIAIYFIYSASLIYGTINTLFGLSLFLLLFAFWYEWHARRPITVALLSVPALTLLTYIHLSTYAFAGLSIAIVVGIEARSKVLRFSNAIILFVPLVFPPVLLLFFLEHGGSVGAIEYGTFTLKLLENLSLFTTYHHTFDAFYLLAILVLLVAFFFRSERITFHRFGFLLGALFYMCMWICPNRLFTSSGADIRFLLPAFIFLVMSADVQTSLQRRIVFSLFLVLAIVRVGYITADWDAMNGNIRKQTRLIDQISENARVYPLRIQSAERSPKTDLGIKNVHCYTVLFRHADDLALDAYPTQHAVAFRHPTSYRVFESESEFSLKDLDSICTICDYLWCFHPQIFVTKQIQSSGLCQFIDSGGGVILWRVNAH